MGASSFGLILRGAREDSGRSPNCRASPVIAEGNDHFGCATGLCCSRSGALTRGKVRAPEPPAPCTIAFRNVPPW